MVKRHPFIKSVLMLILLSWAGMPCRANATPSSIEEVTVFADRALVVRKALVNVAPGEQTLRFAHLTGSMDPNTVQVKGQGSAAIKGVKVEPVYLDETSDQDLTALQKQWDNNNQAMADLNDTVTNADHEKKFIEAIAKRLTTATDKADQASFDPKKWIAMVNFYRSKLTRLDKELRQAQADLKPLQARKQKLEQEMNTVRGRIQTTRYNVSVILTAGQETQAKLEISYVVRGPSWQPKYDIRADSRKDNVQVAYEALIRQNTGEDWRQAKVMLSTAQPQAGDSQPQLQPWTISPYVPAPVVRHANRGRGRPMARRALAAAPAATMAEKSMSAMPVAQAQVQQTATAVNFDIKGRYTIKSDNQPHQVTIMIQNFPAKFTYAAVPKLVKHAFLKAEITNATAIPLLAGETNVFLDNNYVTSGRLEPVAPGETFQASLGADEGFKVAYKLINRKQQTEGVFGGRIQVGFAYRITITNHKRHDHEVVIQDQLPLPTNNDIQVNLVKPAYHDHDPKFVKSAQNLLEWHETIKAGEKLEIPLEFTVSYPQQMKVQGL